MQSRNFLLIILGCVLVFGLVFLFVRHVNEQTRIQEIINEHKYNEATWKFLERQNAYKNQDTISTSPSTENKEDRCVLKRNHDMVSEVILRSQHCYVAVERWNSYLFFQEGDSYRNENIRLIAYNLDTGDRKILYSLEDHLGDFGSLSRPTGISSIQMVENKLYFGLGGYLTGSAVYSLSFPFAHTSVPKLIVANQFVALTYEYGRYWLVDSGGDGGISYSKRTPFDITTDTYGKVIETGFDMGTGTEFIGLKGNEAYIAEFIEGPVDPRELLPTISEIENIYTLNINSLRKEKNIFKKEAAPFPVHMAYYHAEGNRFIFFSNNKIYSYDLSSKKVEPVGNLENESYNFFRKNNILCLNDTEAFNLENNTIIHSEPTCDGGTDTDNLKTKFPTLHLPESFILEAH